MSTRTATDLGCQNCLSVDSLRSTTFCYESNRELRRFVQDGLIMRNLFRLHVVGCHQSFIYDRVFKDGFQWTTLMLHFPCPSNFQFYTWVENMWNHSIQFLCSSLSFHSLHTATTYHQHAFRCDPSQIFFIESLCCSPIDFLNNALTFSGVSSGLTL